MPTIVMVGLSVEHLASIMTAIKVARIVVASDPRLSTELEQTKDSILSQIEEAMQQTEENKMMLQWLKQLNQ